MITPEDYACMVELSCSGEDAHGPDLVDVGDGCRFCDDIRKQLADQIRLAVREALKEAEGVCDYWTSASLVAVSIKKEIHRLLEKEEGK